MASFHPASYFFSGHRHEMFSPIWIESPDGDLYNLQYAVSIVMVKSLEINRYKILIRSIADGGVDEIFFCYDTKESAEEDLALIRSAIDPVLRLRPGASAEK